MKTEDNVYGEFEIKEKVLIELLNSKSITRLKGISQMGMPKEYYHFPVFSRFDHSVGVFLLLRKFNARIEEQIAGILHDVSHTAFSHVIDWVFGDSELEDYQDNKFESFLQNSEIPEILKENGFSVRDFLELERFSLLEQEIPLLCADRIDYCLREATFIRSREEINFLVRHLTTKEGRFVFDSEDAAFSFASIFLERQINHWGANEARARYYILAEALKIALNKKIINEEDIWKTDREILDILEKTKDESITGKLETLKEGFFLIPSKDGILFPGKKFRFVSPEFLSEGKAVQLIDVNSDYKKRIELQKGLNNINIQLKILGVKNEN